MQSTSSQRGIIASFSGRLSHLSEYLDSLGLEALTNSLADKAVRDYQQYVSPRKGFSCAHSKLHEGSSCSGYFRESLAAEGLSSTLNNFPDRLKACQEAHKILTARKLAIVGMQSETSNEDGDQKKSDCDKLLEKSEQQPKKSCCEEWLEQLVGNFIQSACLDCGSFTCDSCGSCSSSGCDSCGSCACDSCASSVCSF